MVLLNVMAFTDRTSGAIPGVESVDSGSGFIGARVSHGGEALIVLLRDDAAGGPLESVSFDAGGDGAHALLVSGLVPGSYVVSQSDGTAVNAAVGADGLLSAAVRGGHRVSISRAP